MVRANWAYWGIALVSLITYSAWAGQLPSPPRLANEPVDEQKYLAAIHAHHNNLVIKTSNPDGTTNGRLGDIIVYNNSGSFKFCLNTNGSTQWRCNANALTAP